MFAPIFLEFEGSIMENCVVLRYIQMRARAL